MTDTSITHDRGEGPLASALDGSRVAAALRAPFRDDSRARRAGRWLSGVVRNSFLYRWLTAEPDPEVVVIDLRETWTVGPVIHVLDRLVAWTTPYWRASALRRGLDGLGALGERAADTRYGRLLVKLLEPPEPPGEGTETDEKDAAEADESPDEHEEYGNR